MSLFGRFLSAPQPQLRDARPADAGALARIHAASFHRGWGVDEFERLLAERVTLAHVLAERSAGAPVAFVLSHLVPPEGEILSIAVAPSARRKGHGARLLTHHLGRLAAMGVQVSHLEVDATNAGALALYRRLGYVEAGRRKGYYQTAGRATDALVLRRDF
ncbi:MAG: GNAT family N-acetyltransferase [Pseudomonadota bacterium]